jgi:uncharacterized membrane protein
MAEDMPSREILEQLVERLDHLESLLQAHTVRLHAIERRLGVEPTVPTRRSQAPHAAQAEPPTVETSTQSPPQESQADETEPHAWSLHSPTDEGTPATHSWMAENAVEARASVTDEAAMRQPVTATREAASDARARVGREDEATTGGAQSGARRVTKRRDLESLIGGVWFAWAGIIFVVLTVAFTLKLAIENDWIGPGARVVMGCVGGLALLYTGERLRGRGLRQYAFILSGGGILILYLSDYAAYNFYQLIPQPVAFLLMAAVTTTAVLLAVRQNALAVAILGLVGGFLTPVLLSTGRDNEIALFTYVALLDAGVLAVAYFKRWRSLDFLSFAGTVLMTSGWALSFWKPEKLWTTLAFLSVFFVLYSLLAVFHNTLARRASRWFDVSLASANASFYFGLSYLLLSDASLDHSAPASQALLISVFFTCLFYTVWRWNADDRLLRYSYVAAAATFLTMALAIQFELHWVTIVWAVEAFMLTWVGLRSGERAPRHAALAVFCAAIIHWFAWDMQEFAFGVDASFVPLLNRRALSCIVLVGSMAGAAWLYRRAGELEEDERSTIKTFFALAGNALALALLSLDVSDYFNARLSGAPGGDSRASVEAARQFSLTALWVLYAATTLALGVLRRFAILRWVALFLLAAVTAKVVALDSAYYAAAWHVPVVNQTFMAYALLVAALAFGAHLYGREGAADEAERRVMRPALLVAALTLALVALSVEAAGYFDSGRLSLTDAVRLRDLGLAKQLSLSVIWALYGAGLLLFGSVRRVRLLRLMALALLSLTTLKVFFWDLSSLDRVYRIISFIVLGAILLAVSYLYQKSQHRASEEDEPMPQTNDTTEATG